MSEVLVLNGVLGAARRTYTVMVFLVVALLGTAFLGTIGFATPAYAQNVVVKGNNRVDTDTVRSFVTLAPGESYTPARIDQAIKDLFSTGLFSDVRIVRQGSGIVVTVVENSLINRLTFVGNSKIKTETLIGELQSRSRGPFSQAMIDQDISRIQDIYRRSGRSAAKVEAKISPQSDGRVDVTFNIDEGSKTGIASINFEGNAAYSAGKLKGVMTTTESNFLSFLKSSDVYDADRIAADLELIRRFYLKNGYADFRVVSSTSSFDAEKSGYILTIVVDEGQRYTIGSARVESRIADIDAEELNRVLRTREGDIYNAEEVEKSVDAISRRVAQKGYAFAQVRPRGDRDAATKTVKIIYSVEEGARVYVERIVIRGNTRTREEVVRREFDLAEGDAYNKAIIDRAERRLRNLGFFKTVRISNEPGSAPDRVIVNVDVEDQATGSFSVAGGYSTSDGFIAEVSLQETNLLGRGQFARISASNGQKSRGGELSFTEPFFLGYRLAAGFDLFTKFSDVTSYTRFENRSTGGTLRLGVPITEEFSVGTRYTLYEQKIKVPNTSNYPYNDCNGSTLAAGTVNQCTNNGEASVAIKEAQGNTVTSLAGLTFAFNTLDNVRDPTSGIFADLKPEFAGLGGDSRFVRTVGTARYYHPITDDFTGLLKVQGGHMFGYGSDKIRVIDHFYQGADLVRGFAPSGIGPRDRNGDSGANSVGGTTYLGASAEVLFPIFGAPRELGLRGAVFADAGTLFGYRGRKSFDLNKNGRIDCVDPGTTNFQSECLSVRDESKIRSSVGVGLLWASPLGPIRFDYAFALTKVDGSGGDKTQAFRFSGGARF